MTTTQARLSIEDEILDFLLSSPSLQEVIDFHVSSSAQAEISTLLDHNREGILSDSERKSLEQVSYLNHLVIKLKAKAHIKIQSNDLIHS